MNAKDYAKNILRARTRQERRDLLAQVPFHLREKVKAQVEWEWRRARKR